MLKFIHRLQKSSSKQGAHNNSQETAPRNSVIAVLCVRLISTLFFALIIWIILISIMREGQNPDEVKIPILIFLFIAALVISFPPKLILAKIRDYIKHHKWIPRLAVFVMLGLGAAARFGFMAFDYVPTSDPLQFFNNATSLSQTGVLQTPSYVGMYPFLYAYDALLAAMFKITGSGLFGIIVLNTAFDALAAFLVGYLIYLLAGSHKWAIISSMFWWISPFNIIFCAISLPVIVVNALILIVLVLLVYLFKNIGHLKRLLGLSVALAIALAAEDAFRPIMIITIIAIVVFYTIFTLKERKLQILWHCVLSLVVIVLTSSVLGYGWTQVVNTATGLPTNTNKQGWSIYVGSNYETNGGWNREDNDYMESIMDEYNGDYSKTFSRLHNEGIERWKSLGSTKAFMLIVKKSICLAGDNQNMIYNLSGSYPYWESHSQMYNSMCVLCGVYWFSMLGFTIRFFFKRRQARANKKLDFIVFMNILVLGLFLAFLVVEVANRYFTIFFPMFTIFGVLGLKNALESCRAHGIRLDLSQY